MLCICYIPVKRTIFKCYNISIDIILYFFSVIWQHIFILRIRVNEKARASAHISTPAAGKILSWMEELQNTVIQGLLV